MSKFQVTANICGTIIKKIPFNSDYSLNEKLNRKAKKYADKLYNNIRYRKYHVIQRIKQIFVIKIGLKPFILRKGNKYEGVQKRWSEIGLL